MLRSQFYLFSALCVFVLSFQSITSSSNGAVRFLATSPSFDILLGVSSSIAYGESINLSDSGFLLLGGVSTSQFIAIKTDTIGQIEIASILDSATYSLKAVDGLRTTQGDFIVLVQMTTQSSERMGVMKLNSLGGIVWSKQISGGINIDSAHYLSETNSGAILLVGETKNIGSNGDNIAIALNGNGDIQWTRYFGGLQREVISKVRTLKNGDFILCGFTFSFLNVAFQDILLVRLSSQGEVVWSRRMGYPDKRSTCSDVIESADGNYIFFIGVHTDTRKETIFGKISIDGNKKWVRVIHGSGNIEGRAILEESDGNLLLASNSDQIGGSQSNILLSTISSSGTVVSTKAFSSSTGISVFTLMKMTDGTVAVAGERSNAQGVTQFEIIKLESNLSYCGTLTETTVTPQSRDISSDSTHLFQPAGLTSLISTLYSASTLALTYTNATNTVTRTSSSTACQLYSLASTSAIFSGQPSSSNCLCSSQGQCNLLGLCVCNSGYSGFTCQYTSALFSTLSANIASFIMSLSTTHSTLSTTDLLRQLYLVTAHPDLVEISTAVKIVEILSTRIFSNSSQSQLNSTFSILSQLSIIASIRFSANIPLTLSLSSFALSRANSSLFQTQLLSINSSLIDITIVKPLTSTTLNSPYLSSSDSSTSILLPSTLQIDSSFSLISILWFENIYNSIRPSGFRSCSPVQSLILKSQGIVQKVTNLNPPVIIRFPVNRNISQVSYLVDDIFVRKSRTKKQVINSKDIQCLYYDQASGSLSDQGCYVSDITSLNIECSCNHLTDFMTFVRASYEPFESSNYNSFSVLPTITWQSLVRNFGFYFSLAYFFSFILTTIICGLWDKKKRKIKVRKIITYHEKQTQNFEPSPSQHQESNSIKDVKVEIKRSKSSFFKKIRATFSQIYIQSRDNKCSCCCFCVRVCRFEIKVNNQVINLFALTSIWLPRLIRLVFLFLSIVIEFTINAFFFDLSQSEGAFDESPFSTQNLIENFWVGLYTALIGTVIMFPISMCFRARKKDKKNFESSLKLGKVIIEVSKIEKFHKTKIALSISFFLLFSIFCCLFVIGFCETASIQDQGDWIISSVMAVVLQMTLFQIWPAMLVGLLAVIVFACKAHRLLCCIICIEGYRGSRNIVGN